MIARSLFCIALSLGLPLAAAAKVVASPAAAPIAQYEELMRLSGMEQYVAALPQQVQAGLEGAWRQRAMSAEESARLKAEAAQAFNPVKFRARVLRQLSGQLAGNDLAAVLAWLRSPLGQEIVAMEVAQAELDMANRVERGQQLWSQLEPAQQERLAALERAIDMTGYLVALEDSVTLSMGQIIARQSPGQEQVVLAYIREGLESSRPQRRQQAAQQVPLFLAAFYENLEPAKLKAYIRYNQEPSTRRYNEVVKQAYAQAIEESTKELLQALIQARGR